LVHRVFGVLNEPKQFEKLVLILNWNSYPSIIYRYLQELLTFVLVHNFYDSLDFALLCELYSVSLDYQQHLLHPMLIAIYDRANQITLDLVIDLPNIFELDIELQTLVLRFLFLDSHHLLDGVPNVKLLVIWPEIVAFDLGVVDGVLDDVVHQLG